MIRTEFAINPMTGERFRCVFDTETCTPVEPIQRFLNYCGQRKLAPSTIDTYAYRLVDYWYWLEYMSLDWSEVGRKELADFANWYLLGGNIEMISEDVTEFVSKRNPRTINQSLTIIRSFHEFHAVEKQIGKKRSTRLAHECGKRIKLKESKVFAGCLTDEQIMCLANSCTTYRDRFIILLLRETGIRRGEIMGLHMEDVNELDVKRRIHVIRRSNPNKAWAKGCEREIPLLFNREEVLKTFKSYLSEEYPEREVDRLGHGMLFVNLEGSNIGHPMSLIRLNKIFEQLVKRTNIKVHPHLLRHTFATRLFQAHYPDHYVQQLMGHKSIITTKNIYSHVLGEMNLDMLIRGKNREEW